MEGHMIGGLYHCPVADLDDSDSFGGKERNHIILREI